MYMDKDNYFVLVLNCVSKVNLYVMKLTHCVKTKTAGEATGEATVCFCHVYSFLVISAPLAITLLGQWGCQWNHLLVPILPHIVCGRSNCLDTQLSREQGELYSGADSTSLHHFSYCSEAHWHGRCRQGSSSQSQCPR